MYFSAGHGAVKIKRMKNNYQDIEDIFCDLPVVL